MPTCGLAVVEADTADDVRAIADDDPAVTTRTCRFEIGALLRGAMVRAHPGAQVPPRS